MMFLVPRGQPVYQSVPLSRYEPPALLATLREQQLTGYAQMSFQQSTGILVFVDGRLLSALLHETNHRQQGLDAITTIFDRVAAEGGALDVYRLAPDLATGLQALLHGDFVYQGQQVSLLDTKGLLTRLKSEAFTGCLRIYTDERSALIFYKSGNALGFFHDGSDKIETEATESQRVAQLPGARLDVLAVQNGAGISTYDLFEMVNIQKVWDVTKQKHQAVLQQNEADARARAEQERQVWLAQLEEDLKAIAAAYLGKAGRNAVDKALDAIGGNAELTNPHEAAAFLRELRKSAKLLTGQSKANQMVEDMKNEIEKRMREKLA